MKRLILTMFLSIMMFGKTTPKTTDMFNNIVMFSEESLERKITELGILYPDVVLAQAKIETGYFTSNIFRENHNMFGMKVAKQRETTAIGENRSHAKYINWVQSLMDYKLWQDKMIHKAPNKRAYLRYLSRNYAEDKNYIKKIKEII